MENRRLQHCAVVAKAWSQRLFIGLVAAVVAGLSVFAGLINPGRASANVAGETYRWVNQGTIEVSGGEIKSDTGDNKRIFTGPARDPLPGETLKYSGEFQMFDGFGQCAIPSNLVFDGSKDPNYRTGTIERSGASSKWRTCNPQAPQYWGKSFETVNYRPTQADMNKKAEITIQSAKKASDSPKDLVIILKGKNNISMSLPATKDVIGDNAARYTATFILEPGDYTVCSSDETVMGGCAKFTPGDYSPPECQADSSACLNFKKLADRKFSKTFGVFYADSAVSVRINLSWMDDVCREGDIGPFEIALTKPDGSTATQNTDKKHIAPLTGQCGALEEGGGKKRNDVSLTTTFNSMPAGTYKACIVAVNSCLSQEKSATQSMEIVFQFDENSAEIGPLTGTGDQESPRCEDTPGVISWVMCSIFNGLAGLSDWILDDIIQPLLKSDPVDLDPNSAAFKIWSGFRIYGDIILVIALIIIVISQAMGGGLVEAYTARKALPRLLIAAILINLSIYIVALAVDLSNIVGFAIGDLMTAPLRGAEQFKITPDGIQSATVQGGTAVGLITAFFMGFITAGSLASLGVWLALFVLLPAAIALIGAFITVILLHAIILALIITASFAFALYALPSTEKYFRMWWDWLFRALLVYPIIMIIFALADIMTVLIMQANKIDGPLLAHAGDPKLISNAGAAIVAFFVQFLPLAMIPFAFKLAGGLVGRTMEFLGGHGKRLGEAIKGNPNDPNSLRNRTKRKTLEKLNLGRANVLSASDKTAATATGFGARYRRARGRLAGAFGDPYQTLANIHAESAQMRERKSASGDDAEIYAGASYSVRAGETAYDGTRVNRDRIFDAKGNEINASLAARSRRLHGATQSDINTDISYAFFKAQNDKDRAAARFAFQKNAEQQGWSQHEIDQNWAQAVFGRKDIDITQWYSKPTLDPATGRVSFRDVGEDLGQYGQMIEELHKSRQPHTMGAERDGGFRVAYKRQLELEQKAMSGQQLSGEELDALGKTYEMFDAMSQKMQTMVPGEEGELVNAAGATPASQGIIKEAVANRQLALGQYNPSTGERQIVGTQMVRGRGYGNQIVTRRVVNPQKVYGYARLTGSLDRMGRDYARGTGPGTPSVRTSPDQPPETPQDYQIPR